MTVFQRIAVVLAILGALLTGVTVMNTLSNSTSGSSDAAVAISQFTIQTASDTTVYQQQVSALWANKDLLKIVADETANANKLAAGQLSVAIATNTLLAALIMVLATGVNKLGSKKKTESPTEVPAPEKA